MLPDPKQCTHRCMGTAALASRPSKVATSRKRSTPPPEAVALPSPALLAPAAAAAPLLPLGCPAGSRAVTVAAASWNKAMLASRSTESGVPLRFRCGRQVGVDRTARPRGQRLCRLCRRMQERGSCCTESTVAVRSSLTCASACRRRGMRPRHGSRRTHCRWRKLGPAGVEAAVWTTHDTAAATSKAVLICNQASVTRTPPGRQAASRLPPPRLHLPRRAPPLPGCRRGAPVHARACLGATALSRESCPGSQRRRPPARAGGLGRGACLRGGAAAAAAAVGRCQGVPSRVAGRADLPV